MVVTRKVSLKDFARKELPEFTRLTIDTQRRVVVDAILRSIPEIVKISPVDTGLYAQSWSHRVTDEAIIFGNTAPHAPVIEEGARPFTPPLAPLLAWAKRVLQDPSQPPHYSDEVQRLARATQAKIARVGMEPKHIMQKGVDMILENMERAVRGENG